MSRQEEQLQQEDVRGIMERTELGIDIEQARQQEISKFGPQGEYITERGGELPAYGLGAELDISAKEAGVTDLEQQWSDIYLARLAVTGRKAHELSRWRSIDYGRQRSSGKIDWAKQHSPGGFNTLALAAQQALPGVLEQLGIPATTSTGEPSVEVLRPTGSPRAFQSRMGYLENQYLRLRDLAESGIQSPALGEAQQLRGITSAIEQNPLASQLVRMAVRRNDPSLLGRMFSEGDIGYIFNLAKRGGIPGIFHIPVRIAREMQQRMFTLPSGKQIEGWKTIGWNIARGAGQIIGTGVSRALTVRPGGLEQQGWQQALVERAFKEGLPSEGLQTAYEQYKQAPLRTIADIEKAEGRAEFQTWPTVPRFTPGQHLWQQGILPGFQEFFPGALPTVLRERGGRGTYSSREVIQGREPQHPREESMALFAPPGFQLTEGGLPSHVMRRRGIDAGDWQQGPYDVPLSPTGQTISQAIARIKAGEEAETAYRAIEAQRVGGRRWGELSAEAITPERLQAITEATRKQQEKLGYVQGQMSFGTSLLNPRLQAWHAGKMTQVAGFGKEFLPVGQGESAGYFQARVSGQPRPVQMPYSMFGERAEEIREFLAGKTGAVAPGTPEGMGLASGGLTPQQREERLIRLYRAHQTEPSSGQLPEWVRERLESTGHFAAQGRWFGTTKEQMEWYLKEFPERQAVSLDIPESVAEPYRVVNQPREVRRFSADPENEYFLPRELAEKARPLEETQGRGIFGRKSKEIQEFLGQKAQIQAATIGGPPPGTLSVKNLPGIFEAMTGGGPEAQAFLKQQRAEQWITQVPPEHIERFIRLEEMLGAASTGGSKATRKWSDSVVSAWVSGDIAGALEIIEKKEKAFGFSLERFQKQSAEESSQDPRTQIQASYEKLKASGGETPQQREERLFKSLSNEPVYNIGGGERISPKEMYKRLKGTIPPLGYEGERERRARQALGKPLSQEKQDPWTQIQASYEKLKASAPSFTGQQYGHVMEQLAYVQAAMEAKDLPLAQKFMAEAGKITSPDYEKVEAQRQAAPQQQTGAGRSQREIISERLNSILELQSRGIPIGSRTTRLIGSAAAALRAGDIDRAESLASEAESFLSKYTTQRATGQSLTAREGSLSEEARKEGLERAQMRLRGVSSEQERRETSSAFLGQTIREMGGQEQLVKLARGALQREGGIEQLVGDVIRRGRGVINAHFQDMKEQVVAMSKDTGQMEKSRKELEKSCEAARDALTGTIGRWLKDTAKEEGIKGLLDSSRILKEAREKAFPGIVPQSASQFVQERIAATGREPSIAETLRWARGITGTPEEGGIPGAYYQRGGLGRLFSGAPPAGISPQLAALWGGGGGGGGGRPGGPGGWAMELSYLPWRMERAGALGWTPAQQWMQQAAGVDIAQQQALYAMGVYPGAGMAEIQGTMGLQYKAARTGLQEIKSSLGQHAWEGLPGRALRGISEYGPGIAEGPVGAALGGWILPGVSLAAGGTLAGRAGILALTKLGLLGGGAGAAGAGAGAGVAGGLGLGGLLGPVAGLGAAMIPYAIGAQVSKERREEILATSGTEAEYVSRMMKYRMEEALPQPYVSRETMEAQIRKEWAERGEEVRELQIQANTVRLQADQTQLEIAKEGLEAFAAEMQELGFEEEAINKLVAAQARVMGRAPTAADYQMLQQMAWRGELGGIGAAAGVQRPLELAQQFAQPGTAQFRAIAGMMGQEIIGGTPYTGLQAATTALAQLQQLGFGGQGLAGMAPGLAELISSGQISPIQAQRALSEFAQPNQWQLSQIGRQLGLEGLITREEGGLPLGTTETRLIQGRIRYTEAERETDALQQQLKVAEKRREITLEERDIQDKLLGDRRSYELALLDLQQDRIDEMYDYQMDQLGFARERFGIEEHYWAERMDLQEEAFEAQVAHTEELYALDRQMTLKKREWVQEDLQYQKNVRAVQVAWSLEDYERNIRFATGRQKKQLMRERERFVLMENMRREQEAREEARLQERWRMEDERWAEQVSYFREQTELRRESMELQKAQHEEMAALQKDQFDRQEEHIKEMHRISQAEHGIAVARSGAELKANEDLKTLQRELQDMQQKYAIERLKADQEYYPWRREQEATIRELQEKTTDRMATLFQTKPTAWLEEIKRVLPETWDEEMGTWRFDALFEGLWASGDPEQTDAWFRETYTQPAYHVLSEMNAAIVTSMQGLTVQLEKESWTQRAMLVAEYQKTVEELKEEIDFQEIGDSWMGKLAAGVDKGSPSVVESFRSMLDQIRDMIEGHSPPRVGPLSQSDKWMPSLLGMMAEDIRANQGLVVGAMENLADGMAGSMRAIATNQGTIVASTGGQVVRGPENVTFNIYGATDPNAVANTVMQKIAELYGDPEQIRYEGGRMI